MSIDEAKEIVYQFNEWRRGNLDDISYTPKEIGVAIDTLLNYIDDLQDED